MVLCSTNDRNCTCCTQYWLLSLTLAVHKRYSSSVNSSMMCAKVNVGSFTHDHILIIETTEELCSAKGSLQLLKVVLRKRVTFTLCIPEGGKHVSKHNGHITRSHCI